MTRWKAAVAGAMAMVVLSVAHGVAQSGTGRSLADLIALKDKVGNADTRVRVDALHRVSSIGVASPDSEVKDTAIGLLTEPVGSASDHIRIPAINALVLAVVGHDNPPASEPEAKKRAQDGAARIEAGMARR